MADDTEPMETSYDARLAGGDPHAHRRQPKGEGETPISGPPFETSWGQQFTPAAAITQMAEYSRALEPLAQKSRIKSEAMLDQPVFGKLTVRQVNRRTKELLKNMSGIMGDEDTVKKAVAQAKKRIESGAEEEIIEIHPPTDKPGGN